MKWYVVYDHECDICGYLQNSLFPGDPTPERLECEGCGYMNLTPPDPQLVPEAFAQAVHDVHGIPYDYEDNGAVK